MSTWIMVMQAADPQSDEPHSKPCTPPHFTAAFDSEKLQHLSYSCQQLDTGTEAFYTKAIFPLFLACIYDASVPTALAPRYISLNFLVFFHITIHHPSLSSEGTGKHYLYLQHIYCLPGSISHKNRSSTLPCLSASFSSSSSSFDMKVILFYFILHSAWRIWSSVPPAVCQTSALSSCRALKIHAVSLTLPPQISFCSTLSLLSGWNAFWIVLCQAGWEHSSPSYPSPHIASCRWTAVLSPCSQHHTCIWAWYKYIACTKKTLRYSSGPLFW